VVLAELKTVYLISKPYTMSILNPKGKKGDKKNNTAKNNNQASKFISSKTTIKSGGGVAKKPMTGGSQRGS
jgi:hypothetical protein